MSANKRRLANANAKRLRATITRLESQPYQFTPKKREPRLAGGTTMALGLTTTSITARSGSTPGTGSVQIQQFASGVLSNGAAGIVTAKNFNGAAIGSGKYCSLVQLWGVWWIVSAEC